MIEWQLQPLDRVVLPLPDVPEIEIPEWSGELLVPDYVYRAVRESSHARWVVGTLDCIRRAPFNDRREHPLIAEYKSKRKVDPLYPDFPLKNNTIWDHKLARGLVDVGKTMCGLVLEVEAHGVTEQQVSGNIVIEPERRVLRETAKKLRSWWKDEPYVAPQPTMVPLHKPEPDFMLRMVLDDQSSEEVIHRIFIDYQRVINS